MPCAFGIGLSFSVGLGKEFYDRSRANPSSSKIWFADLAGAMTGALISSRCRHPPSSLPHLSNAAAAFEPVVVCYGETGTGFR